MAVRLSQCRALTLVRLECVDKTGLGEAEFIRCHYSAPHMVPGVALCEPHMVLLEAGAQVFVEAGNGVVTCLGG